MRGLDEIEYLHPVTVLEGVLSQVLHKFDDEIGLLDLLVDDLANRSTLSLNELMLWQFLIEVLHDFMNRLQDHFSV